jgi:hypothetical protein
MSLGIQPNVGVDPGMRGLANFDSVGGLRWDKHLASVQ